MKISLLLEDTIAAGTLAVAVAAFTFGQEAKDAEITAKHERAAAEKKSDVKPADMVWLRLPLECEQWIAMRGAGEKWRNRPACADLTKRKP